MPPRSLLHRILFACFRAFARPLLHAELLVVDSSRFGICHYNDIERLAEAWSVRISTIFDIGANNGSSALELTQRFPAARIFSFEPHPTTYAQLAAATNGAPQIHTTNSAVGDTAGKLPMTVYTDSRVNTLSPGFHTDGRFRPTLPIEVPVTTIDAICAAHSISTIDLLKIDTEGFDLKVLKGAEATLKRGTVRFIYVECNDLQVGANHPGAGLASIDQLLRPLGYRFIATYNDYNNLDGRLFQSSNALFALPPEGR